MKNPLKNCIMVRNISQYICVYCAADVEKNENDCYLKCADCSDRPTISKKSNIATCHY